MRPTAWSSKVVVPFAVMLLGTAPLPSSSGGPRSAPARSPIDAGVGRPLPAPNEPALPPLARELLKRRMERHGKDTNTLFTAVVMLQREVVAELAAQVAAEPRLVRPREGGGDELNAMLPEKFFVEQDVLRDRAKALVQAAKGGTDAQVAEAFDRVVETCVACHAAFLDPRGR